MLNQKQVIEGGKLLPAFPRVVDEILATLDDPEANMNLLVRHIGRDAVLAGRVFALANSVASRSRQESGIADLYTATWLVGLSRLRMTVICSSLSTFMGGSLPTGFWEHSATVGICAEQLAHHAQKSPEQALIAGLLHDVGQLWLARFEPALFREALQESAETHCGIEAAERRRFGVDHAVVGAWLAESWKLPRPVCEGIRHHHAPDGALTAPMVPVVHVAEVLSNALDLAGGGGRVHDLSAHCCEALGLNWDEEATGMFGRIEALSHFALTFFRPPG